MNRQGFLSISWRHLQQGLFASLTLMATLIGAQQLVKWDQSSQAAPTVVYHAAPQQHFSAVSASDGYSLLAVSEETETAHSEPTQERWVF